MASAGLLTQPKGKSLAISLDGKSLLLGTQGRNAKVYSVAVPTKVTPSPSPSTDGQIEETAGTGRRGTLLALGLAAVVAVVAGVVAGVIHDR